MKVDGIIFRSSKAGGIIADPLLSLESLTPPRAPLKKDPVIYSFIYLYFYLYMHMNLCVYCKYRYRETDRQG